MLESVAELAAKGAALAPLERSRLIDLLLVSLEERPLAEVDAAWDQEVERRLDSYDRGETQSIDGEEVLAEAGRLARRERSASLLRPARNCLTRSATKGPPKKALVFGLRMLSPQQYAGLSQIPSTALRGPSGRGECWSRAFPSASSIG